MSIGNLKTAFGAATLAVSVMFAGYAEKAEAATVDTAIMLAIDGSSSISSTNFATQRSAYQNLLALIPTDGSVAVGVIQFATSIGEVFALRQIDSETDRSDLVNAISLMTQSGLGGLTNLAGAITSSATALTGFGDVCTSLTSTAKCLIDVSTDGVPTTGGNPDTAATNAVAAGVDQVNCLGIGAFADCGFIAGVGSFSVTATTFAGVEAALRTKLGREGVIDDPAYIPLPAAGWLLLGGIGGLVALRRKKAA